MRRHSQTSRWLMTCSVAGLILLAVSATARAQTEPEETPEDVRARQVTDRFLSLLKRTPRFGTALDRVYGFHVERGTLEAFVESLQKSVQVQPDDGTTWMLLGMVELQRGRDADAARAFRQAEQHRPEDPLASWYLGRALVLIGETDQAAAAFERAIEREPQKADLLEIFQALGRIYQRSHQSERALAVWDRLERLFPEDARVQEQIATILSDEGDHEGALLRLTALRDKATDRYRKVQYALEAGELMIKLGRTEEAIAAFEAELTQLKPDSWLHRDVRRRIEDVFLRTDDYAGLVEYYEKWLEQHPDDLDAMTRIGRALAFHGRLEESQSWYQKAIERAPSDTGLRRALIEQLIREDKYAEAIAQCEELDRIDPNNPDNIERWGLLILEDESKPEPQRKQAASAVWRKLTGNRPDDPVVASQVADLLRGAKMTDEAIALYQQAIELAPGDPQYREYLGEYYHVLERPAEAVATWQAIAAGDRRDTPHLVRLAEVYSGFGYDEPALEAMTAACALDPEFADRIRFSQMLRDADRHDDALRQLVLAGEIAESPEETQLVLEERIKTYQSSGELAERTESLKRELDAGTEPTAERWRTLALYFEAGNRLADASQAVASALELDARSVPGWTLAARVYEKTGRIGQAADAHRKLADLDRRYRTEYLKQIAMLEMRLGRLEQSLQAGRDLIAAAPGNPEHYQFFANLCFQLGQAETGLDALRRSVRVNPSDGSSLLALAAALAEQFRTAEAIELYWRAFEKAEDVDGQIGIINNLAELYLRTNHFDRLISRLENRGRELNQERDMTLCLAGAYRAAGDLGMARDALEQLLTEDSRDTQLLTQLSQLAEQEDDYEAAVNYERRINSIAATDEGRTRLANLLLKTGEIDEAEALWERMASAEGEAHRVLQSIDNLIANARYDTARSLCDRLLRQDARNWEAQFRSAVLDWKQDRKDDAQAEFRALLEMDVDEDEQSAQARQLAAQRNSRMAGQPAAAAAAAARMRSYPPTVMRSQATYQISRLLGTDSRSYYAPSASSTWSPDDFGQARVAAVCALYGLAEERGEADQAAEELKQRAESSIDTDPRAAWNWFYITQYQARTSSDYSATFEAASLLAQRPEPEARFVYLASLSTRYRSSGVSSRAAAANATPLDEEQLQAMIDSYELLATQQPEWLSSYLNVAETIITELERAKRDDKAQELYESSLKSADNPQSIAMAMRLAASRGDTDAVLELLKKQKQQPAATSRGLPANPYTSDSGHVFMLLSLERAKQDGWDDVFRLLDAHLDRLSETYTESPPRVRRQAASSYVSRGYYGVQVQDDSGNSTYRQLDYPLPDEYFSPGSITYLLNLYELCKRHDKRDELFARLKQRTQTATGLDQVFAHLAASHLAWWHEDKPASVLHLSQAAERMPDDVSLRLRLAKLFQQEGNSADALALIDSVEPTDHNVLKDREIMALQLAVLAGNIERARKAAGRLFGLRLDADTQVQLAAQMHQLGMHDMAEGVLARTRRQAGNRSSTLITLMQQYQSQGNAEVAVQIAHQVLRRTSPSQNPRYRDENTMAREQALQVLVRSGQLDKLIERAEQQIERSPGSVHLHEILADYYKAAGKTEKAGEILARISEIKPDNAQSLLQLAQQLEQTGDHNGACDKYLEALRKDASVLGNDFYRVQQAFERAKRMNDLAQVMDEIDLQKLRINYYYVLQVAERLMRDEQQREMGLKIFKKAWEAYPDQRGYLIGNIHNAEIWKLPVMFEYARQGVIPQSRAAVGAGWSGIADSLTYYGDGRVEGTVNRLLQGLNTDERVTTFTRDVQQAVENYPEWHAGRMLLCVLDAKAGRHEAARQRLAELLDNKQTTVPSRQGWVLGLELEGKDPQLDELVVRLYEHCLKTPEGGSMDEFQYSPARRLVGLYAKTDRRQQAREIMYDLLGKYDPEQQNRHNPGYGDYQMLQNLRSAADEMLKLEFPVDALRLYNRATPEMFRKSSRWGGGDYLQRQINDGRKKAEQAITPEALVQALDDWVAVPGTAADGKPEAPQETGSDDSRRAVQPVVDLVLDVQPEALDEAMVQSMFAQALLTAGQAGGEAAERISERLESLVADYPDDLSVHVAATLAAFSRGDGERIRKRLQALMELLDNRSPDDGSPDKRPASRAEGLALWLVSREALKSEGTRAAGTQLAERALVAAERQPDRKWLLAMLRERGQLALDQGDREAAEEHWSRMLDLVLARGDGSPMAAGAGRDDAASKSKSVFQQARDALLKRQQDQR